MPRPFEIIDQDDRPWYVAISALQKAGAIPRPISTPEEISFREEAKAIIAQVLKETLTEREIQILELYIMEGKSLRETCDILGTTRITTLGMACSAVQKLREPKNRRVLRQCIGIS